MSNIVNIVALAKRIKSMLMSDGFEEAGEANDNEPNYTDFGWADVRKGTAKRAIPTLSKYY